MKLTLESVFLQGQSDTRKLTNRLVEVENDTNIALRKVAEMYTAIKQDGIECLSVCEINQIISDYFSNADLTITAIDQTTLGQLTFETADPEVPPIVVSLCPHVAHCETETSLLKSQTPLVLTYNAESHVDSVNLTSWFVANNIIWSGNNTGRPQGTVQSIIDEVITDIDDNIDCLYFTGSGGSGAFNLELNDLTDVNTTGGPISIGDYLRYDGNTWLPTAAVSSFTCSNLTSCGLSSLSNVTTSGQASGDVLSFDGTTWRPLNADSIGNQVLIAREKFADTSLTTVGNSATYTLTRTNPNNEFMYFTYFLTWSIYTATDGLIDVTGTALIDGLGSTTPNDYSQTLKVGTAGTDVITSTATSVPLIAYKSNFGSDTTMSFTITLNTNSGADTVYITNVQMYILGIGVLNTPKYTA